MIYLYLFGTCFHFIYVFMIIINNFERYKDFLLAEFFKLSTENAANPSKLPAYISLFSET